MKIPVYCIISLLTLSLAGCGKEKTGPFDDSASVRMQKAVDLIDGILLDGRDGWLMKYFPDKAQWGGFNIYMKFNENKTADVRLLEEVHGMPEDVWNIQGTPSALGLYEVKAEQSVMLTFNTYNRALHYFSLRAGGLGLKADYEFIPLLWDKEHIVVRGKKFGLFEELTVLPAGETIEGYRIKIVRSRSNFECAGYKLNVRGKKHRVILDFVQRQISYVNEGNSLVHLPYIYTPDGIESYSGLMEMTYDGTSKFTAPSGDVWLEKEIPTNYDILTDRVAWYFTAKDGMMSDSFRTAWNKQANNSTKPAIFRFCLDNALYPQLSTTTTWSDGTEYKTDLKLAFDRVDGYDDRVVMKYRTLSSSEVVFKAGRYYDIAKTFFDVDIDPVSLESNASDVNYKGRTYVITLDDPINPKELTLTSVDDPDYWFKLSVYKSNVL